MLDWSANLSTGVQRFHESMRSHDAYLANLPPGQATQPGADHRDAYTLRVTLQFQQETLCFNLFYYERPQHKDRFSKLDFNKRLGDNLIFTAGVNVVDGEAGCENRKFGMPRNDDNAFARIRYSF